MLKEIFRAWWHSWILPAIFPGTLTPQALLGASAMSTLLSLVVLYAGFIFFFPFFDSAKPLLLLPIAPLLSLLIIALCSAVLQLIGAKLPPQLPKTLYAGTATLTTQSLCLALSLVALTCFETQEMALMAMLFLFLTSIMWSTTLLHNAWLHLLSIRSGISLFLAGWTALIAQVGAYYIWYKICADDISWDPMAFVL